jgi:hypothetical protein
MDCIDVYFNEKDLQITLIHMPGLKPKALLALDARCY